MKRHFFRSDRLRANGVRLSYVASLL